MSHKNTFLLLLLSFHFVAADYPISYGIGDFYIDSNIHMS